MKKTILSLTMGAALLIAPMTASALTPMTSDSLKDATGQAGVSIALDNIVIYQSVGETLYTDTDGYYDMDAKAGMGGLAENENADGTYNADLDASVFIGAKEKLTVINAILDDTNRGGTLSRSYGENELLKNGTTFGKYGIAKGDIRPLNIDVASRLPILSPGMMYNATGVSVALQDTMMTEAGVQQVVIGQGLAAAFAGQTDIADFDTWAADGTVQDAADVTAQHDAYVDSGSTDDEATWAAANWTPVMDTSNSNATLTTQNIVANSDDYAAAGATAASVTEAYDKTQVAGVVIGLPTVEITTTSDSYEVGIKATGAHNTGKTFIKITKGASVMAVLGGTIEIAAH